MSKVDVKVDFKATALEFRISKIVMKVIPPLIVIVLSWLFSNVYIISKDVSVLKAEVQNIKESLKEMSDNQKMFYRRFKKE